MNLMLEARAVTFRRQRRTILNRVDCAVHPGEVLGILGANGAGKSTLLSLLAGEQQPDGGAICLNGRDIATMGAAGLARQRAVLPQHSQLGFNLTAQQVVAMGAYPFPELAPAAVAQLVDEALQLSETAHLAGSRYPELSGGEQQRIQFARTLVQIRAARQPDEARYLLLDEPTASLDPRHQHGLLALAARLAHHEHIGVAVVLHDVNLAAAWCTCIAIMANGDVIANGIPAEVLQSDILHCAYRTDCRVHPHPQHPQRPLVLFG